GRSDFGLDYPDWGSHAGDAFRAILAHPLRALSFLVSTPGDAYDGHLKRTYFLELLLPLGFLPILSPLVLIALPVIAEVFLSRGTAQHTIYFHYTALVIPWVMVAAIDGVRRFSSHRARAVLAGLLVACTIGAAVRHGPFSARAATSTGITERVLPRREERMARPYRDRMIAALPRQGGIVASFAFQPRLCGRVVHSLHHVLSGHYTISTQAFPVPEGVTALIAD